jgi:hypothetical protein
LAISLSTYYQGARLAVACFLLSHVKCETRVRSHAHANSCTHEHVALHCTTTHHALTERPGFETRGGDIPQCLCVSGGEPVDTRSSPSKPISSMAVCHTFGTHYEVKPCPSRAELTGGQPQSQPAHNQWSGWYPFAQTTGMIGAQHTGDLSILPGFLLYARTHARTHLQVHRGSPLQVRTRSPLQVRAR